MRWISGLACMLVFLFGTAPLRAQEGGAPGADSVRFGDGRVAELYSGRRPSAKEDQRDWLIVKLGEVGLVVVSDDGKSEILAMDKHGGVYINGDLYVKGEKYVAGSGAMVHAQADATTSTGGVTKWLLALMCVLSVITSVGVSVGLSRR